jgi:hypothetical protein
MRPTLSLAIKFRKLRLTTKDVKKGFYKGNRTGAMGRHTRHGGYIIEWAKVRTYAVPDLEGFKVCLWSLLFLNIFLFRPSAPPPCFKLPLRVGKVLVS